MVTGLFAALLIAVTMTGEARLATGATMLALQAVVVGVVVAALWIRRARVLGSVALTLALLVNVGTVGAAGALVAESADAPVATDAPGDDGYAGIKGVDPQAVLQAPSLEEVAQHTEELSSRIRERLSDEFGLTWTRIDDA